MDMYLWSRFFTDIESALSQLTKIREEAENLIFGAMLSIAGHIGATEEEFLQVHHEVWLRNTKERKKGEY